MSKKNWPDIDFVDCIPDDTTLETLLENLENLDFIDFPEVRYKKGEGFTFYALGERPLREEVVQSFEGIVYFYGASQGNVYLDKRYRRGLVVGCNSADGKTPVVNHPDFGSGVCSNCPHFSFNLKGDGEPACRKQTTIYILRKGTCIPETLCLDVKATRVFNNFLINTIVQKALRYYKVMLKISVTKDEPVFEITGLITGLTHNYREHWLPIIKEDRKVFPEYRFLSPFPSGPVPPTCECNVWAKGCDCGIFQYEKRESGYFNE